MNALNEGTQSHRIMVETSASVFVSKCKIVLQLQFNSCQMLTLVYRNSSVHHAHVPFISAHCIPVSLICYQETGIFTKILSSVPGPLGNVPGKAVCMVYENSSCRLQWPKLTNNGAFQSKCVICLHRRESGLNTDTDSAHTPHISRDEILPRIEAVFTALSNSF